jgi:hypothetical protein
LFIGQHGSAEVSFTQGQVGASQAASDSYGCLGDAQRLGRFSVS